MLKYAREKALIEPTFKNVGLKQGRKVCRTEASVRRALRFVSCAMRLVPVSFFQLGFRPTK